MPSKPLLRNRKNLCSDVPDSLRQALLDDPDFTRLAKAWPRLSGELRRVILKLSE